MAATSAKIVRLVLSWFVIVWSFHVWETVVGEPARYLRAGSLSYLRVLRFRLGRFRASKTLRMNSAHPSRMVRSPIISVQFGGSMFTSSLLLFLNCSIVTMLAQIVILFGFNGFKTC